MGNQTKRKLLLKSMKDDEKKVGATSDSDDVYEDVHIQGGGNQKKK